MKLKDNKGIGLSDAIIAIAIFVIFSGMIISISYNIYLQSNFIKRNDTATNYIVDVFEYAQTLDLDNFLDENDENGIDDEIQADLTNYITSRVEQGYTIQISVNDISNDNNDYESNIIKQIDVSVSYKLSGKIKTVNMTTLLTK